jgi:hypothetical protein
MANQWIIVITVVLAITLGAFLDRLLQWLRGSRYQPKPQNELEERARAIAEWLQDGRQQQILNEKLEGSGSLQELLGWLAKAPSTQVTAAETLHAGERKRLTWRFWLVFAYLVILGMFSGWFTVNTALSATSVSVAASLFAGLFGSCVAAFRSCLDRRANGFEDRYGNTTPDPKATKERFADGMITWFIGRPLLGAAIGAMTYLALKGKVFGEQLSLDALQANPSRLMFYTWVVGLFAKTVLDLLLDLTKKIFPA